jgi:hypothetical protein
VLANCIPVSRPVLALAPLKKLEPPTLLAWENDRGPLTLDPGRGIQPRDEDLERLKEGLPLLEHLPRHHGSGRRTGTQQELVGLCPLPRETRPSFYVNVGQNLFYCHGCGRGGGLLRGVERFRHRSFRRSVAPPEQEWASEAGARSVSALLEELGMGYAPGGHLRRPPAARGYSPEQLPDTGLITRPGRDAVCRRVLFPFREQGQIVNLYGRSIGAAFPQRLLPRSTGGSFAWESVRPFSRSVLAEGLFDPAALRQAGLRPTTCAAGTHRTARQPAQRCDPPGRCGMLFSMPRPFAGCPSAPCAPTPMTGCASPAGFGLYPGLSPVSASLLWPTMSALHGSNGPSPGRRPSSIGRAWCVPCTASTRARTFPPAPSLSSGPTGRNPRWAMDGPAALSPWASASNRTGASSCHSPPKKRLSLGKASAPFAISPSWVCCSSMAYALVRSWDCHGKTCNSPAAGCVCPAKETRGASCRCPRNASQGLLTICAWKDR